MEKRAYDREGHVHFVTFSCYRRRRILDCGRCRQVVIGVLAQELERQDGKCLGFMVMPDHVHCLLWFAAPDRLSNFLKVWKGRTSHTLKQKLAEWLPNYAASFDKSEPIWQKRYYDFNVYSGRKLAEKLEYMHYNPVRAGLVQHPSEWKHGSYGAYADGRSVGVKISFEPALGE